MTIEEIRESFAGKSVRRVSFDLLSDQYDEAVELFRSRDVSEEEGFRVAAISGLLEMKRDRDTNFSDNDLMRQLNRMESAYIGMSNKAFALSKDNELMELSRNGWIIENKALLGRLRMLEARLADLGEMPHLDREKLNSRDQMAAPPEPQLEAPAFADPSKDTERKDGESRRGWFGS